VIRFSEERPPASAEELAAAEERLAEMGLRIPPSYRAFLAERDWGRPVERDFTFHRGEELDQGGVEWFLGVAPVPWPEENLIDVAVALAVPGRVPAGVLPIAEAGGGDSVCLDGREGRDGPVLFWDHEEEEPEDPEDESNLYFVAPDLASFLDGLTQIPLPAEPASGRSPFDWRRLLRTRR
jgi:hypothetical protein